MITPEKLDRAETTLIIRRRIQEAGFTEETLAQASGLSPATIRNIVTGTQDTAKTRRTITEIVGRQLWKGFPPSSGAANLRVVAAALPLLSEVYSSMPGDMSAAEFDLEGKLQAVITPELRAAVAAARTRIPLSMVDEFAVLLPPKMFDELFKITRAPGNPRKIIIGAVS